MPSTIFQDLAALRTQRARQDREIAQIHQELLDRGRDMLLVDEALLQAIEEPLDPSSPSAACGNTTPAWAGPRC